MTDAVDPMVQLTAWIDEAATALGLEPRVPVQEILDVARDAAHGVVRPAAPVSTYLLGMAVARGADPAAAAEVLKELAGRWSVTE